MQQYASLLSRSMLPIKRGISEAIYRNSVYRWDAMLPTVFNPQSKFFKLHLRIKFCDFVFKRTFNFLSQIVTIRYMYLRRINQMCLSIKKISYSSFKIKITLPLSLARLLSKRRARAKRGKGSDASIINLGRDALWKIQADGAFRGLHCFA